MIRPAQAGDAAAVLDIHKEAVAGQCAGHYSAEQIARWFEGRPPDEYAGHIARGRIWVARRDGQAVGFTECWPGHIDRMFVPGRFAGQGVGAALLKFAVARAQAKDGIRIEALLNAVAFYERFGFARVGDGSFVQKSGLKVATVLMQLARHADFFG